ncbi:hypothetical protein Nepgr_005938 [Nepenthes gracilis]|uniref:Dilute domain-containing protein n=1 Tax=Nepenthes gracilis TaxID=150966 RepID=A0AAD3S435_NEPGR|nr:hypothetical protein Nepgr_005938 [Nepenthes gracilis]
MWPSCENFELHGWIWVQAWEGLCFTDLKCLQNAGSAWDNLKHIRQAVGFLVMHQKTKKTLNEIIKDLCPVLSIQQLYRISTMYWDDKYGTHTVSSDNSFQYGRDLQFRKATRCRP